MSGPDGFHGENESFNPEGFGVCKLGFGSRCVALFLRGVFVCTPPRLCSAGTAWGECGAQLWALLPPQGAQCSVPIAPDSQPPPFWGRSVQVWVKQIKRMFVSRAEL